MLIGCRVLSDDSWVQNSGRVELWPHTSHPTLMRNCPSILDERTCKCTRNNVLQRPVWLIYWYGMPLVGLRSHTHTLASVCWPSSCPGFGRLFVFFPHSAYHPKVAAAGSAGAVPFSIIHPSVWEAGLSEVFCHLLGSTCSSTCRKTSSESFTAFVCYHCFLFMWFCDWSSQLLLMDFVGLKRNVWYYREAGGAGGPGEQVFSVSRGGRVLI